MKRQKIRVYCPYFPFPVTEGAYQIMFDQVRVLSLRHDVELVTWKESPLQIAQKLKGADPFEGRVKIISWGLDTISKESTGQRAWRTLKSLVSSVPSPASFYFPTQLDRRSELGLADLAIYHYTYSWNWLANSSGHKERQRIVHLHNVESDLYELRARREAVPAWRLVHRLNARKLSKIEKIIPSLVDFVWYVSAKDAVEFQTRFQHPVNAGIVRPPGYSEQRLVDRNKQFVAWQNQNPNQTAILGFVGTLDFDPNIMSLNWILDHLCPSLEKSGFTGKLKVVGRNPSPAMNAKLKRYSFIEYLGFVESMDEFWASLSAFLIPHIEGSGVRVKLLDAIAAGIPTLANSGAIERVDERLKNSPLLWISDDEKAWTQKILELQGSKDRLSNLALPLHEALSGENIYKDFA